MAAKPDQTLSDIAAELYVLPPDEFTAARNARADELSDSALAKQVRAFRKPLLAAQIVNVFAREHSAELGEALELAEELRDAQADLDAAALTKLSRQRRALIRGLAQQATKLAASRGERVTQATSDAVEQTLNAAMFDADAAAAVASGRLVRPLEPSGDPIAADDLVAGSLDAGPAAPRSRPADEVAARRERKKAEGALRAAEAALVQAERLNDELVRKQKATREQADRLDARAAELKAERERVIAEADQARREHDALDAELAEVGERVKETQRALTAAQSELERLEEPD